tara:strand:+ start:1274 stop:2944 length:1671 start_codon:yes stop_codon:yes gene_type:complete
VIRIEKVEDNRQRCQKIAFISLADHINVGRSKKQLGDVRAAVENQRLLFNGCDVWLTTAAYRALFLEVLNEEPRPRFFVGTGPKGRTAYVLGPRWVAEYAATQWQHASLKDRDEHTLFCVLRPKDCGEPVPEYRMAVDEQRIEAPDGRWACVCEQRLRAMGRRASLPGDAPFNLATEIESCTVHGWHARRSDGGLQPELWAAVVVKVPTDISGDARRRASALAQHLATGERTACDPGESCSHHFWGCRETYVGHSAAGLDGRQDTRLFGEACTGVVTNSIYGLDNDMDLWVPFLNGDFDDSRAGVDKFTSFLAEEVNVEIPKWALPPAETLQLVTRCVRGPDDKDTCFGALADGALLDASHMQSMEFVLGCGEHAPPEEGGAASSMVPIIFGGKCGSITASLSIDANGYGWTVINVVHGDEKAAKGCTAKTKPVAGGRSCSFNVQVEGGRVVELRPQPLKYTLWLRVDDREFMFKPPLATGTYWFAITRRLHPGSSLERLLLSACVRPCAGGISNHSFGLRSAHPVTHPPPLPLCAGPSCPTALPSPASQGARQPR